MSLLYCTIALLAVTVIYLFWRSYVCVVRARREILRERVAHMLWVMAEADDAEFEDCVGSVDRPLDMA
jgi:hypothetical protein